MRAVNDLLQLRRNGGIDFARRDGLFSSRSFMMTKGLGPVNGTLPVSIS